MARKGKGDDGGFDPNAWMATFSDLLSLLLTFFVLLFAMKSLDKGKLEETLGYFRRGGIGILERGGAMPLSPSNPMEARIKPNQILSPADLKRLLETKELQKKVDVASNERGLVLTLSSSILFDSGMADLKPGAEEILDGLVDVVKATDYSIQVEGHTDDLPLSNARYASNWELSVARAGRVLRHFLNISGMSPDRFSLAGYADTRPVRPNNTPGNRAANRRVEFVLIK